MATEIWKALPPTVHDLLEKPYRAQLITLSSSTVFSSATCTDVGNNAVFVKPIVRKWPGRVASGYCVADIALEIDKMAKGNLLVANKDQPNKRAVALEFGSMIKRIISHLRMLGRKSSNSWCDEVKECKALLEKKGGSRQQSPSPGGSSSSPVVGSSPIADTATPDVAQVTDTPPPDVAPVTDTPPPDVVPVTHSNPPGTIDDEAAMVEMTELVLKLADELEEEEASALIDMIDIFEDPVEMAECVMLVLEDNKLEKELFGDVEDVMSPLPVKELFGVVAKPEASSPDGALPGLPYSNCLPWNCLPWNRN